MNITTLERLTTIWKSLKPKSYNVLTRIIVISGLGLFAVPSLIQIICLSVFGKEFYITIFGKNDTYIGLVLVVIGLIYNIISQWNEKPDQPKNKIKNSLLYKSKVVQVVNGNYYEGVSDQDLKEILKSDGTLKDEWFKQIELYKGLLNEFKPITALQLVEALESRLNTSNLSNNKILRSEIEYLKGSCLELIKTRVKEASNFFVNAYELNPENPVMKERACVSYFKIEEFDKAQQLVSEILATNSLNIYANAVKVLLKPDDISETIKSVPNSVTGSIDFNWIIFQNTRNRKDFESLTNDHPRLILQGVELALLDLTYKNYKTNLFSIEVAVIRFLKEYKILCHTIEHDNEELLKSTHGILENFMELLRDTEIKESLIKIEFLRIFIGYLISREESAIFELQRIYALDDTKDELLGLILSNILQQVGKTEEAVNQLKLMNQDSINVLNLMIYCAFQLNDADLFISSSNTRLDLYEEINAAALEDALRIIDFVAIHERINELNLDSFIEKIQNPDYAEFIFIYSQLHLNGANEDYTTRLSNIHDSILNSGNNLSLYLQNAYFMNNNFEDCIQVLEVKQGNLRLPLEISNYIISLYRIKSHNDKLLKWLKYWRVNIGYNANFVRVEIQKRGFISDWQKCADICKFALTHDQNEYYILHLALSYFHRNDKDNFSKEKDRFISFSYQEASNALKVSSILIHFEFYEEGLELCYYWAKEKDDKQARTMFFSSFLDVPSKFFEPFDEVKEGMYVLYLRNESEKRHTKKIDGNDFSKSLIGKKVGDSISIKRPYDDTFDTIKVHAICNKFLALKFEIIDETENPQSGLAIQSFKIDEDGSPMDIINKIAGISNRPQEDPFERYYANELKFSQLAFYASELKENLVHTYFKLVYEKRGILKMDPKVFPDFDLSADYDFILDFTSLLHIYKLEQDGKFKSDYKYKISELVLVMLNSYRIERFGVRNENYVLDDQYYVNLINWIETSCEIVHPTTLLDIMDNKSEDFAVDNNLSLYLLNQFAMIQMYPNSILITDDQFFYTMYHPELKKLMSTDIYLFYEGVKNIRITIDKSDSH